MEAHIALQSTENPRSPGKPAQARIGPANCEQWKVEATLTGTPRSCASWTRWYTAKLEDAAVVSLMSTGAPGSGSAKPAGRSMLGVEWMLLTAGEGYDAEAS